MFMMMMMMIRLPTNIQGGPKKATSKFSSLRLNF